MLEIAENLNNPDVLMANWGLTPNQGVAFAGRYGNAITTTYNKRMVEYAKCLKQTVVFSFQTKIGV